MSRQHQFVSLAVLLFLCIASQRPAEAQRGDFLEKLFRSIAETQREREQGKRNEQQSSQWDDRQSRPINPPTSEFRGPQVPQLGGSSSIGDSNLVPIAPSPLPDSFGERGAVRGRGTSWPVGSPPNDLPSIKVRGQLASEFAQDLVDFYLTTDWLVSSLRGDSISNSNHLNTELRTLLPEAYRVRAEARSLLRDCDGISSLDPISASFTSLSTRWRQLSFALRSLDGGDDQRSALIRRADQLCLSMERSLRIDPPFDRAQLRDLMIVGATYMDVLMDDLQLSKAKSSEVNRLIRECRLLKHRLSRQTQRVAGGSYEEVVAEFTDFVQQWSDFSRRFDTIDDSHVHRSLDRIRDCGNQTYALLWIPPPVSSADFAPAAARLERQAALLVEQLNFRSVSTGRLSSREQARLLEQSRRFYDQSRQLENGASRNGSFEELRSLFLLIDRDWLPLRRSLLSTEMNVGTIISEIDRLCQQLRLLFQVNAPEGAEVADWNQLVQAAAGLEVGSAYLDADIQRFRRYLADASYRNSLTAASYDFHIQVRKLHASMDQRADKDDLQQQVSTMGEKWQTLSREISQASSRGLPNQAAAMLSRSQRELALLVGQIVAVLGNES